MAAQQQDIKLLDPSELGTQEYWDNAYARELHNNNEDTDDEGVVWFEESNAENVVIKKLNEYAHNGTVNPSASRILDLGTGNGHMLFALREDVDNDDDDDDDDEASAWTGEMFGVDYSPTSITLARQLNANRLAQGDNAETRASPAVRFEQWDLLAETPGHWVRDGFDIVLDKGTFDAISLMPSSDQSPHPCDVYRSAVAPLMKTGSLLLVTSCNWTKDELVKWLTPEGGALTLYDEAAYPKFTFGGQTGQSVVTLVFRRA